MFIAVYRFTVIPGMEQRFEAAWLKRTQGIYLYRGSLGSRLHKSQEGEYIAYAQWPSRQMWLEADSNLPDAIYRQARADVKSCLQADETLYELEVVSDYLQARPFS